MARTKTAKSQYRLWQQDKIWLEQWFLRKILEQRPHHIKLGNFLDIVFGVRHRTIEFYTCVHDVRLQGACWSGERKRVESAKRKLIEKFKQGQNACIRIDEREATVTIENKYGCINVSEEKWKREYEVYFSRNSRPDSPRYRKSRKMGAD